MTLEEIIKKGENKEKVYICSPYALEEKDVEEKLIESVTIAFNRFSMEKREVLKSQVAVKFSGDCNNSFCLLTPIENIFASKKEAFEDKKAKERENAINEVKKYMDCYKLTLEEIIGEE